MVSSPTVLCFAWADRNGRCINALTTNSGQICFAATRVYVQEGIYDRFIDAYIDGIKAKTTAIGDPEASSSEIGPVVDKAQYERILNIIDSARDEKQGRILCGGRKDAEKVRKTLIVSALYTHADHC
jgi:acyl-CoA reductase-like NAD-dependent aldehyde dehydrogenase